MDPVVQTVVIKKTNLRTDTPHLKWIFTLYVKFPPLSNPPPLLYMNTADFFFS